MVLVLIFSLHKYMEPFTQPGGVLYMIGLKNYKEAVTGCCEWQ
jgi:hypothetical protein